MLCHVRRNVTLDGGGQSMWLLFHWQFQRNQMKFKCEKIAFIVACGSAKIVNFVFVTFRFIFGSPICICMRGHTRGHGDAHTCTLPHFDGLDVLHSVAWDRSYKQCIVVIGEVATASIQRAFQTLRPGRIVTRLRTMVVRGDDWLSGSGHSI